MKKRGLSCLLVIVLVLSSTTAGCIDFSLDDDDDGGGGSREFPNVQVTTSPENTNEITVVVNPQDPGNIVAGANDYTTIHNDAWCGVYTSMDGGETWKVDLIPGQPGDDPVDFLLSPLHGYHGTGDPVLAAASDGTLYFAGIAFWRTIAGESAIFVARSIDGGLTWPAGDIRIVAQGDGVDSFHDKEWIAVDPNNGNIYCVWAMFSLYSASNIMFSRSTNRGDTWSIPKPISEFYNANFSNQGTSIVVDNTGKIHIIWIDFDTNQLVYVHSSDQGNSFQGPTPIADVAPIPYTPPNGSYRTPTLPALAVDDSEGETDGYLYATWNDDSLGDPDIMVIHSKDGGASWSEPVRVNSDEEGNGAIQFFPAVAVDEEGRVHMIFYDTRDDPEHTLLNVYYSISEDFGQSWENYLLSDSSFDGNAGGGSWRGEITGGAAFIGDYIGIDTGGGYVYGGWSDTRNGEPDDRNSDCFVGIVNSDEL